MNSNIHTIIWGLEFVAFVAVAAIAGFIWRLSKRDSERKKSGPDKS